MLRDKLLSRLSEMGGAVDHQRLAAEVLGIRGAPPELARKLVAQALVVEDRREEWKRVGDRICREAPITPGVYTLRDETGKAVYVGKAINVRRRLRTHFAARRWRAMPPEMARVVHAEWIEVGSELEALVREAALIAELQPSVNVQTAAPALDTRAVPRALVRDVLVLAPSVETDSVELVAANADGPVFIQRTRRNGADLAVHSRRVLRFFRSALNSGLSTFHVQAPLVFSWLAQRGAKSTRLDPHDVKDARELRARLEALFRDTRLFQERLEQF